MKHPGKLIRFLRTTAIGGLIFLLPLIVVGALIGQVAPIVMTIARTLDQFLPIQTPSGIALLILIATGILLSICFAAGLIARKSLAQRLTESFEKKLLLFFPKYAILKDQMADNLGSDEARPQMQPVKVEINGYSRIGFETERCNTRQEVVVYLPGSPDPWSGHAIVVSSSRVNPLNSDFGDAVACCEQLGRGSILLLSESNHSRA